jgi:hypothetical protein
MRHSGQHSVALSMAADDNTAWPGRRPLAIVTSLLANLVWALKSEALFVQRS